MQTDARPAGRRMARCVSPRRAALGATLMLLLIAWPGSAGAAPGDILVSERAGFGDASGGVIRVNPVTGARTVVSSNATHPGGPSFEDPEGIVVAPDGHIFVADPMTSSPDAAVIRVDPVTGRRTTVTANGAPSGGPSLFFPRGVTIDRNGDLLITDLGSGVIRVDPATGQRTTVSANGAPPGGPSFVTPSGISVAANGDILVADTNAFDDFSGGIIRVDRVTGERTTVSANGAPAGTPLFSDPMGVAPAGRHLSVVDDGLHVLGGVLRVDRDTGQRTTVSSQVHGLGPGFQSPTGIALELNGDILVADGGAFGGDGGVMRVDPNGGHRTTVSSNDSPPGPPEFSSPFDLAVEGSCRIVRASATVPNETVVVCL